jgi:hypothetical protein
MKPPNIDKAAERWRATVLNSWVQSIKDFAVLRAKPNSLDQATG